MKHGRVFNSWHSYLVIWSCTTTLPLQVRLQPNLVVRDSKLILFSMSKYPDYLTPNGTPTKGSKGQKSRARREPSGVFSLFQAPQIQQFKEAFQLIDHDKDGWVNESDLKEIFASLGRPLTRFEADLTFLKTFQEYHLRDA